MMSSKEKSYKRTMIITIVISIIVVIGSVSYAFYQTTINGTINGTVAKWNFKANNQTDSFSLDLGELYPGKNGTYNITLSAEESELDVYYELIFTGPGYGEGINYFMAWDSAGKNRLSVYVGRYGIITKGSSVTVPIYFYWPYGVEETYNPNLTIPEVKIIARQYTGYSGSIPMNLLGFTKLISYNNLEKRIVLPMSLPPLDQYGYNGNFKYKFESIDSTSGYIWNGSGK